MKNQNPLGRRNVKDNGPDPIDVHVGTRVRLRRNLLGLSQEELAAAINVSFQQVQKYERGANRLSASRLFDVARALGVDISFFFDHMPEEIKAERPPANDSSSADPATTNESMEMLRIFNRASEDQRRAVHGLLRSFVGV